METLKGFFPPFSFQCSQYLLQYLLQLDDDEFRTLDENLSFRAILQLDVFCRRQERSQNAQAIATLREKLKLFQEFAVRKYLTLQPVRAKVSPSVAKTGHPIAEVTPAGWRPNISPSLRRVHLIFIGTALPPPSDLQPPSFTVGSGRWQQRDRGPWESVSPSQWEV